MLYPSIDKLLAQINPNRFKIILAVASRARDLDDKKCISLVDSKRKSISTAIEELTEGKIVIIEKYENNQGSN